MLWVWPEHDLLVETDDEAADPDEDQEGEEDCDEDGVADTWHRDITRGTQLVRSRSPVPVVPQSLITTNVFTAHTTSEVRGSVTGLPSMLGGHVENSLEHLIKYIQTGEQGERLSLFVLKLVPQVCSRLWYYLSLSVWLLLVAVCAILSRCPSDRGQVMVTSYYSYCRTMHWLCQNILFKLFISY